MFHQVVVHPARACEERELDPQHVAMIAEDQTISSRRTIVQVIDVESLQLATIMLQTDEAHPLHHAVTKAIRREFLDQLLPHADLKQQPSRTTGTSQGITST